MPALPEIEAMDLLRTIKLVWTQHRAFQAALAELMSYSQPELGELGITRADIPRIAYAEAERRVEGLAPRRPARESPSPHGEPEAAAA
jgi:uncharacterized protein YjiS (DUF1127 family)